MLTPLHAGCWGLAAWKTRRPPRQLCCLHYRRARLYRLHPLRRQLPPPPPTLLWRAHTPPRPLRQQSTRIRCHLLPRWLLLLPRLPVRRQAPPLPLPLVWRHHRVLCVCGPRYSRQSGWPTSCHVPPLDAADGKRLSAAAIFSRTFGEMCFLLPRPGCCILTSLKHFTFPQHHLPPFLGATTAAAASCCCSCCCACTPCCCPWCRWVHCCSRAPAWRGVPRGNRLLEGN